MGSLRARHDWATSLSLFTFLHWRRKWQPTPVFLPGESQGQGSLVGCRLWVTQSQTRLKRLSSSSGSSIFNFLRNLHIVCQSNLTNSYSYQQCTRAPFSPRPHQHLLSFVILGTIILTGVRWYLVVLICISLMMSDVEHPFVHQLAICKLSFRKYLFSSSVYSVLKSLFFWYWVVWVPYMF